MRSSFHRSLSLAAVALATGAAFAGTPLPDPPFSSGGFLPPDRIVHRQELSVSKVLANYARKSAKCDYVAVEGLQLAYQPANPTKIAELQQKWTDCRNAIAVRYALERDKVLSRGTPACLDQAGIDAVRAQIDAEFPPLQGIVFCDDGSASPDPVTNLNIPDFKNEANGEVLVAKLTIRLGYLSWKCYLKALVYAIKFGGTIPPEVMPRIDACFDKIEAKGLLKMGEFDQQQKLPDCLPLATAEALVATTIGVSGQFTDDVFCASPSGAFLD
jgi:hypothetical protein